jgi:hypothetical protein
MSSSIRHLAEQLGGSSFDVTIRLKGFYGFVFLLICLLCIPNLYGAMISVVVAIAVGVMFLSVCVVMLGIMTSEAANIRDLLLDILSPTPRYIRFNK